MPVSLPKPTISSNKARPDLYPSVTIDDREARIHDSVVTELENAGVPIVVERMDFSDYAFSGALNSRLGRNPTIGIEVSSVSDVVGKLNNDRLAFQLSNMLLRFDVSILLITSPIQTSNDGWVVLPRMPKACTFDRLMDVLGGAQAHGVVVQYAAGTADVSNRLLQIFKYWSRDEGSHKYFRPRDALREVTIPIGEEIDKRIACLMTLPGIGEQRAVDALKVYGSVRNVMLANEDGLRLIPGWGALTAKKVSTFLIDSIGVGTLPRDSK